MAGVNDINIENQLALETLKRLGSGIIGGLRNLNQPPQTIAPNIYGTQPQPASVQPAQSAVTAKYQRGGGLPAGAKNIHSPGTLDPSKPMAYTKNADGSVSTVRTINVGIDGRDALIPTVDPSGKILSNEAAIQRFKTTGQSFGTFTNPADASAFGLRMHKQQEGLLNDPQVKQLTPGMSLSADKTTYTFGTPGQDGYGRMTVSPGTPMSAEEARFRAPVTPPSGGLRATGRMIQAVSPDYSFLRPAPTTAPIDFASMNRPERRFALRNAQLSQEQQQLDNTYDLGLRTVAASQQNALLRDQETPAQAGLRQAQAQEAGARTSLLTEQAKIAGNEKFITTFEETPYTDPLTKLTEMRRSPILVNPNNPNEVIRPGQTATKAPTEADFTAALDANPERRKAYNSLSPEKQAKLRDKFLQSGAM